MTRVGWCPCEVVRIIVALSIGLAVHRVLLLGLSTCLFRCILVVLPNTAVVASHDFIGNDVVHLVGLVTLLRFTHQSLQLMEVLLLLGDLLGKDQKAIVDEELHLLLLVLRQRGIRHLILLLLKDQVRVLVGSVTLIRASILLLVCIIDAVRFFVAVMVMVMSVTVLVPGLVFLEGIRARLLVLASLFPGLVRFSQLRLHVFRLLISLSPRLGLFRRLFLGRCWLR